MADKKVQLEINGKIIRVTKGMVDEISRFGVLPIKKAIKNPPKEVLAMLEPNKIIFPKTVPPVEAVVEKIEVKPLEVDATLPGEPEKKERKKPVRSKSTKK